MTVSDFISALRSELDDKPSNAVNRLWSDLELAGYLDEGLNRICRETLVLKRPYTISVVASTSDYSLDARIVGIDRVQPSGRGPLTKRTTAQMDALYGEWRTHTAGVPRVYIEDTATDAITFYQTPSADEAMTVTAFTLPLIPVVSDASIAMSMVIELDDVYLEGVRYWCLYRAYDKRDVETLRPEKSAENRQRYDRFVDEMKRWLNRTRGADGFNVFHRGFF